MANFSEFDELNEELLKADFEQFLQIYAQLQQKILDFSNQLSSDPTKADTLTKVHQLLLDKIRLVERHQHDIKTDIVSLLVSLKIQKKYTAE